MSGAESPAVSVVIPVFNKAALFQRCADSVVAAARHSGAEVIFVDHGSTDGARDIAAGFADATVVDHRGGTVASVRNAGAKVARGSLICFLDSDVTIPLDYFDRARAVVARTGAGAVGYECDIPANPGWLERAWHGLNAVSGEGERWYINAANLAVRRDAFLRIGGWKDGLVSAEEVDLCRRLRLAGYQVWAAPELTAVHLDNPRTIPQFFRKQVWHGLGVPASDRRIISNKVMALAAVHLLLAVAAVAVLATPVAGSIATRAIWAGACLMVAPLAGYGYRVVQTGRIGNPFQALVLFQVYFAARAMALLQILLGRTK